MCLFKNNSVSCAVVPCRIIDKQNTGGEPCLLWREGKIAGTAGITVLKSRAAYMSMRRTHAETHDIKIAKNGPLPPSHLSPLSPLSPSPTHPQLYESRDDINDYIGRAANHRQPQPRTLHNFLRYWDFRWLQKGPTDLFLDKHLQRPHIHPQWNFSFSFKKKI